MSRWDPGTEDRLIKAALDLYAEHGYDNVTVTQIAERAGITRRSYFRYFPDKREVLFAGSEQLPIAVREAVRSADACTSPLDTVLGALAEVGTQLIEHVSPSPERRAIIRASPELLERERTKSAAVTAAIREGLEQRNFEPDEALLVAQIASLAMQHAFDRWFDDHGRSDFRSCLWSAAGSIRKSMS